MKRWYIFLFGFILLLLFSINFKVTEVTFIQVAYIGYYYLLAIIPLVLAYIVIFPESKYKSGYMLMFLRSCFFIIAYGVLIYLDQNVRSDLFEHNVIYIPNYFLYIFPIIVILNDLIKYTKEKG